MTIIKASLAALLGVLAAAAALVVTHLAQLEALYRWAYVSAAWPAVGGVTLLHTPHALKGIIAGHPARAVQAVAWRAWTQRPVGQRWALLQAHTHAAAQMRLWLYIEVAVLTVLVASLAFRLLRGTWGPLWFVLGRVGRLQPGETHGKAAWADKRVARSLRPRRGAAPFVLGHAAGRRLIALPEALQYLNTLIVGRPGAGKSTLLIGNLLRERGTRSLVLTDPKSELWDTTSRHIGAHHRTLRLDFYDPSDQGAGYNPLAHITTPADALRFSQVWLANTREQDSEPPDSFWDATVALLLQAAILHLNHRHKAQGGATLPQLAAYLSTTDAKQMQEDLAGSPVPGARQAAQGFLRTIQGNERLAASVFVGLPLRFLALQDEAVQITTSHDSLGGDFSALGRREGRPVALYLVSPAGVRTCSGP